jgi:uracil-DNA glycosylase
MEQRIADFVACLAQSRLAGPAFNQYALVPGDPELDLANAIRRQNLRLYLQKMAAAEPWLLLVGEAPGYRGCRLTGVPFTSEAIILDSQCWPFGAEAGFSKTAERNNVVREATATMVWAALAGWRPPPLLWNALPFHAYQEGRPASNRRPDSREMRLGAEFLVELGELFRPRVVAAAGQSAARALELAGVTGYRQLRHPSHGGKAGFLAGLGQIRSLA